MKKILLISDLSEQNKITEIVNSLNLYEIITISQKNQLSEIMKKQKFEMIIINIPFEDDFIEYISKKSNTDVLVLCEYEFLDIIYEKVNKYGIYILPKPCNRALFLQTFKMIILLKSQNLNSKNIKFEEKMLIDRAKATLMQYLKFTEPQAHRYIEKQAMNSRQTKTEIAQRILTTYET